MFNISNVKNWLANVARGGPQQSYIYSSVHLLSKEPATEDILKYILSDSALQGLKITPNSKYLDVYLSLFFGFAQSSKLEGTKFFDDKSLSKYGIKYSDEGKRKDQRKFRDDLLFLNREYLDACFFPYKKDIKEFYDLNKSNKKFNGIKISYNLGQNVFLSFPLKSFKLDFDTFFPSFNKKAEEAYMHNLINLYISNQANSFANAFAFFASTPTPLKGKDLYSEPDRAYIHFSPYIQHLRTVKALPENKNPSDSQTECLSDLFNLLSSNRFLKEISATEAGKWNDLNIKFLSYNNNLGDPDIGIKSQDYIQNESFETKLDIAGGFHHMGYSGSYFVDNGNFLKFYFDATLVSEKDDYRYKAFVKVPGKYGMHYPHLLDLAMSHQEGYYKIQKRIKLSLMYDSLFTDVFDDKSKFFSYEDDLVLRYGLLLFEKGYLQSKNQSHHIHDLNFISLNKKDFEKIEEDYPGRQKIYFKNIGVEFSYSGDYMIRRARKNTNSNYSENALTIGIALEKMDNIMKFIPFKEDKEKHFILRKLILYPLFEPHLTKNQVPKPKPKTGEVPKPYLHTVMNEPLLEMFDHTTFQIRNAYFKKLDFYIKNLQAGVVSFYSYFAKNKKINLNTLETYLNSSESFGIENKVFWENVSYKAKKEEHIKQMHIEENKGLNFATFVALISDIKDKKDKDDLENLLKSYFPRNYQIHSFKTPDVLKMCELDMSKNNYLGVLEDSYKAIFDNFYSEYIKKSRIIESTRLTISQTSRGLLDSVGKKFGLHETASSESHICSSFRLKGSDFVNVLRDLRKLNLFENIIVDEYYKEDIFDKNRQGNSDYKGGYIYSNGKKFNQISFSDAYKKACLESKPYETINLGGSRKSSSSSSTSGSSSGLGGSGPSSDSSDSSGLGGSGSSSDSSDSSGLGGSSDSSGLGSGPTPNRDSGPSSDSSGLGGSGSGLPLGRPDSEIKEYKEYFFSQIEKDLDINNIIQSLNKFNNKTYGFQNCKRKDINTYLDFYSTYKNSKINNFKFNLYELTKNQVKTQLHNTDIMQVLDNTAEYNFQDISNLLSLGIESDSKQDISSFLFGPLGVVNTNIQQTLLFLDRFNSGDYFKEFHLRRSNFLILNLKESLINQYYKLIDQANFSEKGIDPSLSIEQKNEIHKQRLQRSFKNDLYRNLEFNSSESNFFNLISNLVFPVIYSKEKWINITNKTNYFYPTILDSLLIQLTDPFVNFIYGYVERADIFSDTNKSFKRLLEQIFINKTNHIFYANMDSMYQKLRNTNSLHSQPNNFYGKNKFSVIGLNSNSGIVNIARDDISDSYGVFVARNNVFSSNYKYNFAVNSTIPGKDREQTALNISANFLQSYFDRKSNINDYTSTVYTGKEETTHFVHYSFHEIFTKPVFVFGIKKLSRYFASCIDSDYISLPFNLPLSSVLKNKFLEQIINSEYLVNFFEKSDILNILLDEKPYVLGFQVKETFGRMIFNVFDHNIGSNEFTENTYITQFNFSKMQSNFTQSNNIISSFANCSLIQKVVSYKYNDYFNNKYDFNFDIVLPYVDYRGRITKNFFGSSIENFNIFNIFNFHELLDNTKNLNSNEIQPQVGIHGYLDVKFNSIFSHLYSLSGLDSMGDTFKTLESILKFAFNISEGIVSNILLNEYMYAHSGKLLCNIDFMNNILVLNKNWNYRIGYGISGGFIRNDQFKSLINNHIMYLRIFSDQNVINSDYIFALTGRLVDCNSFRYCSDIKKFKQNDIALQEIHLRDYHLPIKDELNQLVVKLMCYKDPILLYDAFNFITNKDFGDMHNHYLNMNLTEIYLKRNSNFNYLGYKSNGESFDEICLNLDDNFVVNTLNLNDSVIKQWKYSFFETDDNVYIVQNHNLTELKIRDIKINDDCFSTNKDFSNDNPNLNPLNFENIKISQDNKNLRKIQNHFSNINNEILNSINGSISENLILYNQMAFKLLSMKDSSNHDGFVYYKNIERAFDIEQTILSFGNFKEVKSFSDIFFNLLQFNPESYEGMYLKINSRYAFVFNSFSQTTYSMDVKYLLQGLINYSYKILY